MDFCEFIKCATKYFILFHLFIYLFINVPVIEKELKACYLATSYETLIQVISLTGLSDARYNFSILYRSL